MNMSEFYPLFGRNMQLATNEQPNSCFVESLTGKGM